MLDRSKLMVLSGVLAFVPQALAQKQIEMSQDGCAFATFDEYAGRISHVEQGENQMRMGAPIVPFGVTPDWQNAQRRQVGGLKIADMNGDGLNDLVVVCFNSSASPPYTDWRNFIHYNTGTQLEALPSWISTDQVHSGDIQIADFNLDGHPDVFAANGGFSHSASVIYFNNASGTGPSPSPGWASSGINAWALAAAAFDFDHDGDIDVMTTNQSGITNDNFRPLYLFRNNAGVMQSTPAWQSADQMISNGISVGDFDKDGWEDVAVAKWVNFKSAIYKNNNGTFGTLPVWDNNDSTGGRGAGFVDYDKDGWLDVAYGIDPTRIYRNNGNGTFSISWESTAASPSVQELLWHDVNADTWPDLIEINFST